MTDLKLEAVKEMTVSELLAYTQKLQAENQKVIRENVELIFELEVATAEIERMESPTIH